MDFASLQVFKAVADEGGISPAARKLHRVQSNVTTRIQGLEASLGTQLFVREKRRLHLSPAGQVFLQYVEQMLRLAGEARNAVAGDAPRGVLRIGTLEVTAASRLPPLLARYHAAHPAVAVELVTGTTDALVEAVLGRRIEAAFVADCKPSRGWRRCRRSASWCSSRRARIPAIRRAADVRADTLIVFPTGCAYRRRLQGWLGEDGVVPDKVLELASYTRSSRASRPAPASASSRARCWRRSGATRGRRSIRWAGERPPSTTALVWRKGELSAPLKALQAEVAAIRTPARRRR